MPFNKNNFKPSWITEGITNPCVDFAEEFGEHLCDLQSDRRPGRNALTTSQIRNFFGEVKRIEMKGFDKETPAFLLIRPKLAYAEARAVAKNRNSRLSDFRKVVEKAHLEVKTGVHFKRFVDFLEATLAYHKAFGGKES